MKRKLVRQGISTLTVALPKSWCATHHLQAGDDVHLSEKSSLVVISPGRPRTKQTNTLSLAGASRRTVWYWLVQMYIHGFDELVLENLAPEHLAAITVFCHETIGFTIVAQTSMNATIKDLGGEQSEEVPALINRVLYIVRTLVQEYQEELQKKEFRPETTIREQDRSVNRLVYFCLRVANKRWQGTQQELTATFCFLNELERASDDIAGMWKTSRTDAQRPKVQDVAIIRGMLDNIQQMYQKKGKQGMFELLAHVQESRDQLRKAKLSSVSQFYLRSCAERILDMAQAILSLKLSEQL